MNFGKVNSQELLSAIDRAVAKGWIRLDEITNEEFLKLPPHKKRNVKMHMTEEGKLHMGEVEPLLQSHQEDSFVKDVHLNEKTGDMQIELTKEGVKARQLAIAMNVDFKKHLKNVINETMQKKFSEFIILDKKPAMIDGRTRFKVEDANE